jgi:hypothetical protein
VKHTYDPGRVITAVTQILRDAGIDPNPSQDGYGHVTALAGAGMLLRGLGVFPATGPADAYRLTLDHGSWEDTDNRRAQQYTESPELAHGRSSAVHPPCQLPLRVGSGISPRIASRSSCRSRPVRGGNLSWRRG